MARGTPDGSLQPYTYASQVVDPGMIYQMLWGFSPIDGQGRVIYLDTFNNGLGGFGFLVLGTGKIPVIVAPTLDGNNNFSFSPPNVAKLSAGIVAADISGLYRQSFLGFNTRLGFEVGFTFTNNTPDFLLRFDYKPTGLPGFIPGLRYNHSINKFQIDISGGGQQDIFTMPAPGAGTVMLIQIKFVGDWATGKYVRAFIGDTSIDLSSYTMLSSVTTLDGFASASARAVSYGAGSGDVYMGYFLLTKDEP